MLKILTTICGFLGLPSPQALVAYALAFVVMCSISFVGGWTVNNWRWEAAISNQKSEAATLLQRETEEAAKKQRADQQKTNQLEVAFNETAQKRDELASKNAELATKLNDTVGKLNAALGQLQSSQSGRRQDSRSVASTCPATSAYVDRLQEANAELSRAVGKLAERGNWLAREADREAAVAQLGADFAIKVVNGGAPIEIPAENKPGSDFGS